MTRNLVGICRTDSLACSADFTCAHLSLAGSVEQTVSWHDEMSLLGYAEYVVEVYAVGFELSGLLAEEHWVEHNAVADNICNGPFGENARGNGAEHMLVSVEFKGVARIRTALETSYYIIIGSENIDNLAFALVAPLET